MKNDDKRPSCLILILFLVLVPLLLAKFIVDAFPINALIGIDDYIIQILFLSPFTIIFTIAYTAWYITAYDGKRLPYLILFVTILLSPFLLKEYAIHKSNQYLKAYPENNLFTISLERDFEKIYDSGIGDSIGKYTIVNDVSVRPGDTITVRVDKPIKVVTNVFEQDDKYNDTGGNVTHLDYYTKNPDKLDYSVTFEQEIRVTERGGRINSGSVALFKVKYKVKRVIPDIKFMFSLLMNITNDVDYFYVISIIISGIVSLTEIVKAFIRSIRAENELIERRREERLRKENKI